jgi:hypothetical protein
MEFRKIIKSHYDPSEESNIIAVLRSQGLYKKLQSLTDNYHKSLIRTTDSERLKNFRQMVMDILLLITVWIRNKTVDEQKDHNTDRVMHLVCHLIRVAVLDAEKEEFAYAGIVEEIMEADEMSIQWIRVIIHYFKGDVLRLTAQRCSEVMPENNHTQSSSCPYISWVPRQGDREKHISFELFLDDLMSVFKEIHSKKTVAYLFKADRSDYKIIIMKDDVIPFQEVFRVLHKNKRIKCHNSRGLFVLLKAHFEAPDGKKLYDCKQYYRLKLKKLRCPSKQILLMKRIKPLIEKYS